MCTKPIKIKVNKDEVTVKCGKCDTCRRQKAQEWAIKLINELKYHKKACFITLTFDNRILGDKKSKAVKKYGAKAGFILKIDYSMEYFKKFIKRLRKHFAGTYISYYHVGEYGEKTKRPHHHAIIYGINFEDDRREGEKSKSGHVQYISKTLDDLWGAGRCTVQDCNSNNIIYIAQYTLKKFKQNEGPYKSKMTFSNRCKINTKFIRKYPEAILKGYLTDNDGKRYKVPESYKKTLKESEIEYYNKIYREYEEKCMEYISNNSNHDLIKKEKTKEEIRKLRERNIRNIRDF